MTDFRIKINPCPPATVENSDASYTNVVASGGLLTLPDQAIQNNGVASGFISSVGTINVTTNSAPTSFTITGRTIDIVVPSGTPTGDYLVRFFDIDGTILKEEYVDSGNDATAPSNPTYDSTYLTFKEWNINFTNVTQDLNVGAIYDTNDGKTYLFLRVTTVTGLQPELRMNKSTTDLMTINWGDGNTNTTSSSGNVTITKTGAYSAVGNYVVSIECSGAYAVDTGGYILGNNTTYSRCLLKAYLGTNFTSMSASSFRQHTSLSVISICDNVTSLGFFVFQECFSLIFCNIPNSVTSTNASGFISCNSLVGVTLPISITTYTGSNMFNNCRSLKYAILMEGVTNIDSGFFNGCTSLEYYKIPTTLTTIGTTMFTACTSLREVIIPNGITAIPEGMFNGCLSLSIVNIPTSAITIGAQTFLNCGTITEAEFPSTFTTFLGIQTFSGCSQILEYTFLSTTPPTLGNINVFNGIQAACKIYVPDANVAAYQAATNWSTYANYIYPLSTKP